MPARPPRDRSLTRQATRRPVAPPPGRPETGCSPAGLPGVRLLACQAARRPVAPPPVLLRPAACPPGCPNTGCSPAGPPRDRSLLAGPPSDEKTRKRRWRYFYKTSSYASHDAGTRHGCPVNGDNAEKNDVTSPDTNHETRDANFDSAMTTASTTIRRSKM